MLICAVADTHELHAELSLQPGDLFIHAGDILFAQNTRPLSVLRDFDEWLGNLPYRYKLVVPGNHDKLLENPRNRGLLRNAMLLVNAGVSIEGIRIWGSPVTPLPGEPFGMPDLADRKKLWARIPKGTEIIITHGPTFGVLDQEADSDVHQGCPELRDAILRVRPRVHIFGHIHGGYGLAHNGQTLFVNAALYKDGILSRRPIVLHITHSGRGVQ